MSQNSECTVLPINPAVQPGVINRNSNAGSYQHEQRPILLTECIDPCGLNVDDANKLVASDHGHGEFCPHGIKGAEITRVALNIAHQNGLPSCSSRARDAFPERNCEIARDLVP